MIKDAIKIILENNPKSKWIEKIKPYIVKETSNELILDLNNPFESIPCTLKELVKGKFNIEPGFYTHKSLGGIVYIGNYLAIDDRFILTNKEFLMTEYGSLVFDFYGVNDNGYTYGFESGLQPVYDINLSHYSNFKKINYIPKEGELLYYLEKLSKREITSKIDAYEDYNIYTYTSGRSENNTSGRKVMRKFKIGDTSKRKILQSFFIEYS